MALVHGLRRLSVTLQPSTLKARFGSANKTTNPRPNNEDAKHQPSSKFLALPPEIRNQIYQYAAQNTILVLARSKPRRGALVAGLLLANKQIAAEYRHLLFSHAHLVVAAPNYELSHLQRVLSNLSSEDLRALQSNPHLYIVISLSHVPTNRDRAAISSWIKYRDIADSTPEFLNHKSRPSESPPALQFHYDVKFRGPVRAPRPEARYANQYDAHADLLLTHVRMLRTLREREFGPEAIGLSGRAEASAMGEDLSAVVLELQRFALELSEQMRLFGPGRRGSLMGLPKIVPIIH